MRKKDVMAGILLSIGIALAVVEAITSPLLAIGLGCVLVALGMIFIEVER